MTSTQAPNPRRANGHRRNQVRRRVLAEESDCWLCGKPVDKTFPPHLPGSPEVDEVIPVSLGGSPIDRANCRLAHRLCNVRRGDGTRTPDLTMRPEPMTTTRDWAGGTPSPQVAGPVGSSRVDLQACKLEYSIVSPK